MQVKRTNKSDTEIQLTITADPKSLNQIKQIVLSHMNNQHVKLPGFRAGKAPLQLVEKHADQNALQQQFLEEAVNRLYATAIQQEKLRPVSQPKITLTKFVPFTDLEFSAILEAVGDVKLPNYTVMKRQPPKVTLSKEEVDEVIKLLRKRIAERKEVTRAASDGDELIIDFHGIDQQSKPINGADGKDYPLILGSNTFIPGFEPKLVGMKPSEVKTFTTAFPKNYAVAALQSKKVTFTVTIIKINELKEPSINDNFAAKVGPFKSIKELRDDIKKQLTLERQQESSRTFENELLNDITAKVTLSVPDSLVEEQVMRAEQEEKQNLTYRGQTWQKHLTEEGVSEEEHRKRNRPMAKQSVKAGLVLAAIADRENITVTPEELEIRMQILKGQYTDPAMQAEFDKPEARDNIAGRLRSEKTLAKLVGYATKE